MNTTEQLKQAIEEAAARTGRQPSTIGREAGQGGKFYERLCKGKRVWPETAEAVLEKLSQMKTPSVETPEGTLACNANQSSAAQGPVQARQKCISGGKT